VQSVPLVKMNVVMEVVVMDLVFLVMEVHQALVLLLVQDMFIINVLKDIFVQIHQANVHHLGEVDYQFQPVKNAVMMFVIV